MRILLLMLAVLTIAGCASGTPTQTTPRCQFDRELLPAANARLPDASKGDLGTLRMNREDSKLEYKSLAKKHGALAKEVEQCINLQGSDPAKKTKLEQRLERMEGRVK